MNSSGASSHDPSDRGDTRPKPPPRRPKPPEAAFSRKSPGSSGTQSARSADEKGIETGILWLVGSAVVMALLLLMVVLIIKEPWQRGSKVLEVDEAFATAEASSHDLDSKSHLNSKHSAAGRHVEKKANEVEIKQPGEVVSANDTSKQSEKQSVSRSSSIPNRAATTEVASGSDPRSSNPTTPDASEQGAPKGNNHLPGASHDGKTSDQDDADWWKQRNSATKAVGKTVLYHFRANWCGACNAMRPTIDRLQADGFNIKVIDVDQEPVLAQQYGVSGIPCSVFLADSTEANRVVGAVGYDRLAEMFATSPNESSKPIPLPEDQKNTHDDEVSQPTPPRDGDPKKQAGELLQGGKVLWEYKNNVAVQAIAWSPDRVRLAVGDQAGNVHVLDARNGERIETLDRLHGPVTGLAWGKTGLAASSKDGSVRVWFSVSRDQASKKIDFFDGLTDVCWDGHKPRLFVASAGGIVYRVNRKLSYHPFQSAAQSAGQVENICFADWDPSRMFASSHADGTVVVWDMSRGQERVLFSEGSEFYEKEVNAKNDIPYCACYEAEECHDIDLAPQATLPLLAVLNTEIEIWDVEPGEVPVRTRILPAYPPENPYRQMAWMDKGQHLIAGRESGEISAWRTSDWKMIMRADFNVTPVIAIQAQSTDSEICAVSWEDGTIRALQIEGTKVLLPNFDHEFILQKAKEFAVDEEWHGVSRAITLLNSYQLSVSEQKEIDRTLASGVDRYMKAELKQLTQGSQTKPPSSWVEKMEHNSQLQSLSDLRPDAKAGAVVRRLIRQQKNSKQKLSP